MKIKHIALAISSVALAGSLLTVSNATDQTFTATLTVAKPKPQLTIGPAAGTASYGDTSSTLTGTVGATGIVDTSTYTITFVAPAQTTSYGNGLSLEKDGTTGAAINSMAWSQDGNSPVAFLTANGGGCDLSNDKTSVTFNGTNKANCVMGISGTQLATLTKGTADYKSTIDSTVYGVFSQTITYTIAMS